MLSFEILNAQEGPLDKENFGSLKLITSLSPMGFLRSLLTSFEKQSQNPKRRERKRLAWHEEVPSNPSSVATRHTSE